jgi:predicted small integral membrane protein
MAIRYFKIVLVAFVGLQALFYVAGNTANWDAGLGYVGYVIGQVDHQAYPAHIFPAITNPTLVVIAYLVILAGETATGLLSLKGAWDLWRSRKGSAEAFNGAKNYAVMGLAMAMVVWFGLFIVVGGALFQMWQTEGGNGSFMSSFVFTVTAGLILLFVMKPDA